MGLVLGGGDPILRIVDINWWHCSQCGFLTPPSSFLYIFVPHNFSTAGIPCWPGHFERIVPSWWAMLLAMSPNAAARASTLLPRAAVPRNPRHPGQLDPMMTDVADMPPLSKNHRSGKWMSITLWLCVNRYLSLGGTHLTFSHSFSTCLLTNGWRCTSEIDWNWHWPRKSPLMVALWGDGCSTCNLMGLGEKSSKPVV